MRGGAYKFITDSQGDHVLCGAALILLLNVLSPVAAFPFQVGMLTWCVWKCDVKYLPVMIILMLNKHCFTLWSNAYYVKLRLAGFGFSVLTIYAMAMFVFVIFAWFRHRFDRTTGMWILLWIFCLIPVC